MKKKTLLILAATICVVSFSCGALANGLIQQIKAELRHDFTIKVDGEVKTFKDVDGKTVYPVLYEGTTYLPVRAIGELMGKTVYWYEKDKVIELKEEVKPTVTDADVIVTEENDKAKEKTDKVKDKEKQPLHNPKGDKSKNAVEENYIGSQKAKEIALKKAGLTNDEVVFIKAELDNDKGVWHYEIEFKEGITEYDAEINALDGTIISWETDID